MLLLTSNYRFHNNQNSISEESFLSPSKERENLKSHLKTRAVRATYDSQRRKGWKDPFLSHLEHPIDGLFSGPWVQIPISQPHQVITFRQVLPLFLHQFPQALIAQHRKHRLNVGPVAWAAPGAPGLLQQGAAPKVRIVEDAAVVFPAEQEAVKIELCHPLAQKGTASLPLCLQKGFLPVGGITSLTEETGEIRDQERKPNERKNSRSYVFHFPSPTLSLCLTTSSHCLPRPWKPKAL